jgi:hypothetical protein
LIILWVRKRKDEEGKGTSKNNRESSRKHDEIVKKFHVVHPERELKIVNPRDIKANGNLTVSVERVKPGNNRQN